MNIDFGPMTLECMLQDFLEYDETDTESMLSVASDCGTIIYTPPDPPNEKAASLNRVYSEVCAGGPSVNWGMQFKFLYDAMWAVGSAVDVGIFGSSSEVPMFTVTMRPVYAGAEWSARLAYTGMTDWIEDEFVLGTEYGVRVYSYYNEGLSERHDFLEVWSLADGNFSELLAQLDNNMGDVAGMWDGVALGDMNMYSLYRVGAWYGEDLIQRVCELYVSCGGDSPVLPMIRNQSGTLGKQLIR